MNCECFKKGVKSWRNNGQSGLTTGRLTQLASNVLEQDRRFTRRSKHRVHHPAEPFFFVKAEWIACTPDFSRNIETVS